MIHTVDILRYTCRGDIPIIILERIEINECYRDMPVFTVGRIG